MQHEIIPFLPASESPIEDPSRPVWVYYPKRHLERPETRLEQYMDHLPGKSGFHALQSTGGKIVLDKETGKEDAAARPGHSLFQDVFFFCTIKKVGDIPATACIYVETVIDRDSGVAFAKVYSAKSAMNAVDILATRVMPFFKREGVAIKDVHTRRTSEYCGFLMAHSYETFLIQLSHSTPPDVPARPTPHPCLRAIFPFPTERIFPGGPAKNISSIARRTPERPGYFY